MNMPYQNEIIFFAGYGVICIIVLCIFIAVMFFAYLAANQFNEFLLKIGNASRNLHALSVLNRINNRKRFLKTGVGRAVFVKQHQDNDDFI
jgi:septation ring formation regulator EzrA